MMNTRSPSTVLAAAAALAIPARAHRTTAPQATSRTDPDDVLVSA